MRFHIFTAFAVLAGAIFFRISPVEWCVVLLCISSVISAELINTSIEYSIDLSTPEKNVRAGQAKDMAAAAVLVVAIVSAVIGFIIFLPKLIRLFTNV
jgi:diacylglycerol kinase